MTQGTSEEGSSSFWTENRPGGIDVSHHQGEINWQSVAEGGIAFAFAKATDHDHFQDQRFQMNWAGMQQVNILRGAYHYFRYTAPAEDQAQNFLSCFTTQLQPGDLPPTLDVEELGNEGINDQNYEEVLDSIQLWLDLVENALGRQPIIYTNRPFWRNTMNDTTRFANYSLWIANWTTATSPQLPSAWQDWIFWQYSQTGAVDGINGSVDLDWFNGNLDQLRVLAGYL